MNFTDVLYLTLGALPFEYINEMRKQYPENDIKVLIPIINTYDIKPLMKFDYFTQNHVAEAAVYKLPENHDNIQVYGIYSSVFSSCKNVSEIARFHYLVPFLKAARIAIKKIKPDIVHCENIPFFLGEDFEKGFPDNIKVLQSIKDFTQIDISKPEAFWAAINLADKSAMKQICRDKIIKTLIAKLFKLHNTKRFYQMRECLKYIYKNYYKFRKYIDKGEDIEENVIFNKLNSRVLKLFPQMNNNTYLHTLKRANYWVTTSETYYTEVLNNPKYSGLMYPEIVNTKEKSDFVSFGINSSKYGFNVPNDIYQAFNAENFRELRNINKTAILKELSSDRIKTNFVDPTLFNNEEASITGSLDRFYEAPLLFAHASSEIFANGIDILFNTILKLFEMHKSIQVIICIKDGLKVGFIKSWLEFLQKNKQYDGKWVFIDGNVKLSKFYASSDITLIPRRANLNTPEHYIAMRYGCVPVAARVGILNDTISDIFDDMTNGCGLKTKKDLLTEEDNNELFLAPVIKALNIYQHNPSSWKLLIKNCMLKDCSWNFDMLEKYNKIYREILK